MANPSATVPFAGDSPDVSPDVSPIVPSDTGLERLADEIWLRSAMAADDQFAGISGALAVWHQAAGTRHGELVADLASALPAWLLGQQFTRAEVALARRRR